MVPQFILKFTSWIHITDVHREKFPHIMHQWRCLKYLLKAWLKIKEKLFCIFKGFTRKTKNFQLNKCNKKTTLMKCLKYKTFSYPLVYSNEGLKVGKK